MKQETLELIAMCVAGLALVASIAVVLITSLRAKNHAMRRLTEFPPPPPPPSKGKEAYEAWLITWNAYKAKYPTP